MRTARLVGPTADGRSVVLVTEDGEELTVPIDPSDPDDRLARSLLGADDPVGRTDDAAPPPPAPPRARRPPRRRETPPMDTPLSPRDIQQRIRAGESLEDLVASSGMEPDRVERFAAPVLAEREHMALTALSGSVRRRGESSGHRPLRTVVAERLLGQGVDADEVTWDAWKREDGQWQVTADFELLDSERHAEFRFDPQGRFSLAEDDDARWLAGERPSPVAAVVDRDDELALVRATSELAGPGNEVASDAYADDESRFDEGRSDEGGREDDDTADVELTEDLVAVLQVVPPAELSAEELAELTGELDLVGDAGGSAEDPAEEPAGEGEPERESDEDRRARARDEAAEPTVAVVRHLTQVTVEVERDDASDEGRSALDTLYDMLGGDGYAEESTRVYPGLTDAAAVPVVDEHEFEPPAAVFVPADPGPETADGPDEAVESTTATAGTARQQPEQPALDDEEPAATEPVPVRVGRAAPAAAPTPDPGSAEAGGEPAEDAPEPVREAAEAPAAPAVDEPLVPSPGAPRKPGRRKRASVPSWDEIMFGGPKPG